MTTDTRCTWRSVVSRLLATRLIKRADEALASILLDKFELILKAPSHYDDTPIADIVAELRSFFHGLPGVQSDAPVMASPFTVRVFEADYLGCKSTCERLMQLGSCRQSVFGLNWLDTAWRERPGSSAIAGSLLDVLKRFAQFEASLARIKALELEASRRLPDITEPFELSYAEPADGQAWLIVRAVLASWHHDLLERSCRQHEHSALGIPSISWTANTPMRLLPMTGSPAMWQIVQYGHAVYVDEALLDIGARAAYEKDSGLP